MNKNNCKNPVSTSHSESMQRTGVRAGQPNCHGGRLVMTLADSTVHRDVTGEAQPYQGLQ